MLKVDEYCFLTKQYCTYMSIASRPLALYW